MCQRTSPLRLTPPKLPTEGDDSPTEEVHGLTIAPDSTGHDQSAELEHPLPTPHLLPVQSSTHMPHDQAGTLVVEKAQTGLDRVDKCLKESID